MCNLLLVSRPLHERWSCLGWVRCAWIMSNMSRLGLNTCFEHSFVCELFCKNLSWLECRCRLCEMWLIFIDNAVTHSFCHTLGHPGESEKLARQWSSSTHKSCFNSWTEESDPLPPAGLTLLTSPRSWNFLNKISNSPILSKCKSSQDAVRTEYEQLQLTVCTSLAAFVWWYLCRTNGCWWAEMVDSPRSFIYLPLIWSRQLDLWHCHMGTRDKCGTQWRHGHSSELSPVLATRHCSKRCALLAQENTLNTPESIEYLCHHLSV